MYFLLSIFGSILSLKLANAGSFASAPSTGQSLKKFLLAFTVLPHFLCLILKYLLMLGVHSLGRVPLLKQSIASQASFVSPASIPSAFNVFEKIMQLNVKLKNIFFHFYSFVKITSLLHLLYFRLALNLRQACLHLSFCLWLDRKHLFHPFFYLANKILLL